VDRHPESIVVRYFAIFAIPNHYLSPFKATGTVEPEQQGWIQRYYKI
jgi:hypothetical protein